MKFIIKHETKGRMRVHLCCEKLDFSRADTIQYYFESQDYAEKVKVYERTNDLVISYAGARECVIDDISRFKIDKVEVPESILNSSAREINARYKEKLIMKVTMRGLKKLVLPVTLRNFIIVIKAIPYIWSGIKTLARGRIEVPVLDAMAITASIARSDFKTSGSVMFLLEIGELLEEWTHKKSVEDLAKSMALNVDKIWLLKDDQEISVRADDIKTDDIIRVHMSCVIPFDGDVVSGDASVNQASLTGESMPVHKNIGDAVFAGSVIEEGDLVIKVKDANGSTKYDKIIAMIEETEKLKSTAESKAEHLADRLVPYTLAGTALAWLITRNVSKTLSVLMVDFSCALKMAMPITVLSAIKEANQHSITVKGGKFLEAVAEATTIVFDKTGTLTKARPKVREVISYCDRTPDELLKIAACLEEHFPHSMANAVLAEAESKGIVHEEMHSEVKYIVAHGIASFIDGKKAVIGSHHFVMGDEGCSVSAEYRSEYDRRPMDCSHLYLAIDSVLVGIICIEDPIREETPSVIEKLRELGFEKIVMMTGDSRRTAEVIAKQIGVDEYYAEVLPEDKANFVIQEKKMGKKVVMVGDGINDSPALSASDVGIAISDGAAIAREIADITIKADNLDKLVTLRRLSLGMEDRVKNNYKKIVGINGSLIALGVAGVVAPTTSALLHNSSTVAISVSSMKNILDK